ncbi:MAG TPA: NAD(P)H-dependent oxidoreductase subunit E [Firmicutes bacterium]|jgi:NADH-quinone oxidoreductase subunit E|nr:NAD(P)H-dependent oxidoreductase subunit E [Bacillota bacterium]
MVEGKDRATLDHILTSCNGDKRALIAIMQKIQHEYRYLPRQALEYVAKKLGVSPAKIYSVATFYENFSLRPKGRYIVRVCDGTACHVRKSASILKTIREGLGLDKDKTTTDDMLFTVETVSCLGACGLSPVISINEQIFAEMTPEKALACLNKIREKEAGNYGKKREKIHL